MVGEVLLRAPVAVDEEQARARSPRPPPRARHRRRSVPASCHPRARCTMVAAPGASRATFGRRSSRGRVTAGSVGCPVMSAPVPTDPAPPRATSRRCQGRRGGRSALRLLVSVGVLTLLVLKTPHLERRRSRTATTWRTASLLRRGAAAHPRRHRAVGLALAAGAARVRPARRPRARSPRTPSPASSSATCCRRRSAATSCASAASAPAIDSTETAFASVALERLTGFVALPALVRRRVRAATRRCSTPSTRWSRSLIAGITLAALVGDPRRLAAHPQARGPLRRATRTGRGSSARSTSASTACAATARGARRASGPRSLYQVVGDRGGRSASCARSSCRCRPPR